MPFDFKISLNISFGKRKPPAAPEPEQRETSLDAMVERAEPSKPPELHGDVREEPMYRVGQRVGFTATRR